MVLNIDLEKAFGRLEWSFIYPLFFQVLTKLSKLIMKCFTTSNISILVNGSRMQYFSPNIGIRQEDHMSPYLFNICMKIFSILINHNMDIRSWTPIKIGRNYFGISQLVYADDVILMS